MSSKRVVLRAHDRWLDDFLLIADEWFTSHGYAKVDNDKRFQGIAKHDIRLGYIGGDRFHIIVDLEEDASPKPVDPFNFPTEIYRVRRGADDKKMAFQYIDEKEQPNVYSAVREFGRDFPWGC